MATNGKSTCAGSTPDTSNVSTSSNSNLGKDEVAWYFVEQYYTTLSKSPEKLHLFYSKRSQLVYGKEAEVSTVSVGRQEIQERIKSLDFKEDTKVRISNVDSQTSFDNIVIQVIGESSNKTGEDPKKFVQTFVLAQQPSGYFVLNDILRYVDDGAVEEEQAEEPVAAEEAPAEQSTSAVPETAEETAEPAAPEPAAEEPTPASTLDPAAVDQKLEEVSASGKDASVNGDAAADQSAVAAPAAETAEKTEASKPDPEALAKEVEAETTQEPEKPTDPSPTPVVTRQAAPPPAAAPAKPAQPAQPPKPMTWAGRIAAAAAANAPKPALPKAAAPAAAAAPAQPRPTAQAAAPAAQSAATTTAPSQSSEPAAAKESTEWQTAGGDNKRARPQSISAPRAEKEGTLGYVKYVTEKVESEDLRAALAAHGELVYFDINRQKSCAFVEFANPAGYNAAAAANPHVVNGESIVVEPRRPKASAYGGANYSNTGRGNAANRGGRGGMDGGRAGGQGGRGNFGGQNRGRGGMPRGGARGASQAANA
ncbi:NTF2 and RRM domain-containing protein [Apiospora rasikravindrae]|uniref:NTF2 and RRM domain-containing protein n=1 Tax=Apiospora rasikravindrae TaxID=990691 RepID=A0ABR1SKH0_9PEZI